MNQRQKKLLKDSATIIGVTAMIICGMVQFKNFNLRAEAFRAMEDLAQKVIEYKKNNGSVPPQSYVDNIKESLIGSARFGGLKYRALWIDFESSNDEILAYYRLDNRSLFFKKTAIVLRLDGKIEKMDLNQLESLLAQQQSPQEIQQTTDN